MANSPGTYKGVVINAGTDAQVAQQIAAINNPVDTSSFTPAQLQAYNNAASLAPISSATLQQQSPIQLPKDNTPTPATLPTLEQILGKYQDPSAEETKAKSTLDSLLADIGGGYDTLGGQTATRQSLETQLGVPDINKQLQEVYAKDAGYQAELSGIDSQLLQGAAAQQGTSTGELGRRVDLKDLNYKAVIAQQNINIQRATNIAVASALQGKLSLAQDYVQKALDAQFKPLEAKLEYQKLLLNNAYSQMDSAEKKKADALKIKLDERGRLLDQQQADQKSVYSVMMEAAQNGADNLTLQKIQNTKTPDKAIIAAGSFIQDPNAALDTKLKQLQIQKAQQDLGGGGVAGGGVATGEEGTYRTELADTGRQAVFGMLNIAEASPGIFGKTAALPIPDFARSDAFRNYKAQLDFLKGNIIPAALTAMREASKTGGALGQVSDREGAWLASSLGALEMTQSPEQVKAQLRAIDAHLATWQSAVEKYGGGGFVTTAPDGTQVEIID